MLARERAVRIGLAEARAGVLETGPDTDTSKRIRQYQAADSFQPAPDTGYDWCVSFIVWCYREAGRELTETGRSASVPFTETKARTQGWVVRKPKRGDIVCIQRPPIDPTPDHIAIVVDVLSNGVRTVEGNTPGEGGNGVFVQTRSKEECETFIRVPGQVPTGIGRGDLGADVKELQRQLVKLGHKKLEVDGDFGDKTEKALKTFQRRNDLPETGVATAKTRAVIKRALQPPTPPPLERGAARPRFNVAATFPGGATKKAERLHPRTAMNKQVNAFLDEGATTVRVSPA
jgi:Putative peptidoglycan binding domain/CHAP domain